MPKKTGRFIVDTHVHGQRHALNFKGRSEDASYESLADTMRMAVPSDEADEDDDVVVFKNTERIRYDMETYGVDKCVLVPAFGMENRLHKEMVEANPDDFVAFAGAVETMKDAVRGEREYSYDRAAEELDELLEDDAYVGIGEAMPTDPTVSERVEWPERRDQLRKIFEVGANHDVPVSWHTGRVSGYASGETPLDRFPDWKDPSLAAELAGEYDDVPIILNHGGMQGTWQEDTVDKACQVAASHDNVYLELGLYWADLLKKPINDPNIGIDQLLWGTDWGASIVAHSQPNEYPPIYWDQVKERGLPAHQVDYWGTSLRQFEKFALENDFPQDELNMILGGNACDLLDIDPPQTRLFPEYLDPPR